MWGFNLRKILKQSTWDKIRKKVYQRANYKCEICGLKGIYGKGHPVECHELWSYDEVNKIQKLSGLLALCPLCHQVKHFGFTSLRGEYYKNRAKKHLMYVNNINVSQANKLISDSFILNDKRSQENWDLDISDLEKIIADLTA